MALEPVKDGAWFFDALTDDWRAGREQWREIARQDYDYALGVVPPMYKPSGFILGELYDHHPRLGDVGYGFVQRGERYFARLLPVALFEHEAKRLREEED